MPTDAADADAANSGVHPGNGGAQGAQAMILAFLRMPMADKLGIPVAWTLMGLSAAALHLLPIRRIVPLFGDALGPIACVPLIGAEETRRALWVRRAVARAERIAPFRSNCLPQAMVGAALCRILRIPAAVHLGVKLDDAPGIVAHAWLCAGRVMVTGGPSFQQYHAIGCFAPRARMLPTGI